MIGELVVNFEARVSDFNADAEVVENRLQTITKTAQGLSVLHSGFLRVATGTGLAATAVGKLTTVLTAATQTARTVTGIFGLMADGLSFLMIIPKAIAVSFGIMFAAMIAPFKIVLPLITLLARGLRFLAIPFVALAKLAMGIKGAFSAFGFQLVVLRTVLSFLPPKFRLAAGALLALGVAGRAGKLAMKGLAFGIQAAGAAARVGRIAMAILSLRVLKALKLTAMGAARAVTVLTTTIYRLGRSVARLGMRGATASLKAFGSVAAKVGGMAANAAKGVLLIAAAAAGWGVKLAADAESAEVAFTTMLKSGAAARTVLAGLEQFAASTPFQLNDLRDGAKQLLNAQIPTTELTNRLRMLGDIAAGTGKPINDFVRIFAKVKSTGKVSLETLNQLAERGVPIYSALGASLGKTRTEMLSMISKGKVGFEDLDTALKATATGTGVFAGGMAAASQTTNGLVSTLKDNLGFAVRALGAQLIGAFDFKGLLADGIGLFQRLKTSIEGATPLFMAVAATVKTAFASIWEVVTVATSSIAGAFGVTSGNIMESLLTALGIAKFVFREWPTLAELAFKQMALHAATGFNTFTHFFTGVLPALFSWFTQNWLDIFKTAGSIVTTFFANLQTNIWRTMKAIWAFIKSGGTESFKVAFVPMLDGFKNSISKMPDIPPRVMGTIEKQLAADVASLATTVGTGMAKEIQNNLDMLNKFRDDAAAKAAAATVPGTLPDKQETGDGEATKDRAAGASNALLAGSSAALNAVLDAQGRSSDDPQVKAVDKTTAAVIKAGTAIVESIGVSLGYGVPDPVVVQGAVQ